MQLCGASKCIACHRLKKNKKKTCISHYCTNSFSVTNVLSLRWRNWTSLAQTTEELAKIWSLNSLRGFNKINYNHDFKLDTETRTRGHLWKLSHFFAWKVVGVWKGLPSNAVAAYSLGSFKSWLMQFWDQLAVCNWISFVNVFMFLRHLISTMDVPIVTRILTKTHTQWDKIVSLGIP